MANIFISHSSRNSDRAIDVRNWLAANGWDDVFLDLDPERGIVAGQRWKEALQKAAHRCEVVLALVSPEWLASSWCKSEIDAARLMGKKIIIALIGVDKSLVPLDLSDEQWIDLVNDPAAYLTIDFSREMKPASLPPAFTFNPSIPFNVRIDPSDGRRAIIAPSQLLASNTAYRLALNTAALDIDVLAEGRGGAAEIHLGVRQ